MARTADVLRETGETRVELRVDLDGTGRAVLATGIGFFDHMLTLLARHSLIDLEVRAEGDLHVDPHHTVEDVGICYGLALKQALGDKAGIRRYGSATLPMDEVLVTVAVDLSGRPFCVWNAEVPRETLGTFNAPLAHGSSFGGWVRDEEGDSERFRPVPRVPGNGLRRQPRLSYEGSDQTVERHRRHSREDRFQGGGREVQGRP